MSALVSTSKPAPPILLERDVLEKMLQSRPLWELGGYKNDGSKLKRVFVAQNVLAAHEFMSKVGELSESMRHHPDIHISTRAHVEVGNGFDLVSTKFPHSLMPFMTILIITGEYIYS